MSSQDFITQPQAKPEAKPPIPEAVMQKFTEIVQSMLSISNELGLELATIDCDKWKDCPICLKSRELVKKVKELLSLSRTFTR